jgi:hypothetical protein
MKYEIIKGHPSERECVIGAYEACGLMATYRGYYDQRFGTWTLYPLKRYALPAETEMKKFVVTEKAVHLPKARVEEKLAVAQKKDEPKAKAWWALPDPDGQMELL